jgi:hypothetical protein
MPTLKPTPLPKPTTTTVPAPPSQVKEFNLKQIKKD